MNQSAELADATLRDVAGFLRNKVASPGDLVSGCLERIERFDPFLHAFLQRRDAAALETARVAAKTLGDDGTSLLTGVPLAHKDMFYRTGELVTFGAHPRRAQRPSFTATVKMRLDALHVPDLGSLNMSEYAAGPTGINAHHGRCRNPWAGDRISGGSSSGSAVAVASRMIYGSLGSDTGGSIRIPAALCGVTGLKPTFGRVSRHGAMPRVWSQDSIGPIARSADDCALILSAVAGPDGLDPLVVGEVPRFEWPSPTVHRGARIGVLEIIDEANRDVERCVEQATADLRRGGHAIDTATWTNISDVIALAETVHKVEATTIHDTFLREQPESYSAFLRERLEDGLMIPAVRYLQALSLRALMARDFVENVLRDFDAVVLPTVGSQAPLASELGENSDDNWLMLRKLTYFTRPFSYLGLPALTVPCGFGDAGMPVGLQIIGRPFDEATILSVGHTYQRATDWHNKCPALSA